eukprot:6324697-Amphidinium_carterae.2
MTLLLMRLYDAVLSFCWGLAGPVLDQYADLHIASNGGSNPWRNPRRNYDPRACPNPWANI